MALPPLASVNLEAGMEPNGRRKESTNFKRPGAVDYGRACDSTTTAYV